MHAETGAPPTLTSGRLPTDEQLLVAHRAGHPHAFCTLLIRHRDRMLAVAVGILRDRDEAADAVQDAYLSALNAARRFRGDAAVTTWLHRITTNACLDRIRRRRTRPVTSPFTPELQEPAASGDAYANRQLRLDIDAALHTLTAAQRRVVELVDLDGHTTSSAAALLGIAEGTVKSRCVRGRAALAVHLAHHRDPRRHERPRQPVPHGPGR